MSESSQSDELKNSANPTTKLKPWTIGWQKLSSTKKKEESIDDSAEMLNPSSNDTSTPAAKSNGWGATWSSGKKTSSMGWGKPANNSQDQSEQKTNGWGKGSLWGSKIINPFSKDKKEKSESSDSQKDKSIYQSFGVKPPQPEVVFNFGTGVEFQSTHKPDTPFEKNISTFKMPKQPKPRENIEEPKVVDLPEVEERTGEEGEDVLFDEIARAYVLKELEPNKPGYAEIGIGEFHLNHNTKDGFYRMTMRRDKQNIVLNTRIFKGMKPKLNKAYIQFIAFGKDQKMITHTFRFENEEKAKKLYDLIIDIISKL